MALSANDDDRGGKVNRITKVSRLYDDAKPSIESQRMRRKLARTLFRQITPDTTVAELRKMATVLNIKGRSKMVKEDLVEAIHGRTK
jgi:hypothetical protein